MTFCKLADVLLVSVVKIVFALLVIKQPQNHCNMLISRKVKCKDLIISF